MASKTRRKPVKKKARSSVKARGAKGKGFSRGELGDLLGEAFEGGAVWLHRLALKAGYARGDFGRLRGKDLASLWGVTEAAVTKWWKKLGCPRNRDGSFDLTAVILWRENCLRSELEAAEKAAAGDDDDAKRYRKVRADKEEFQLSVLKGRYVSLNEMKDLLGALASSQRNAQGIMRKRHGNEAGDLWEETLVEAGRALARFLEDKLAEGAA